ncbi:MAG: alpha/beta fold hydrolase [Betaproteobacteria bacterium]
MSALALAFAIAAGPAVADPCAPADDATHVTGVSQCLLARSYGPATADTLVVWLHGDVSSGGPATYHFALAERTAASLASKGVAVVALVRPGYPDDAGASSSVSAMHAGRNDHYTKENVSEVGAAIDRLRERTKAKRVVVAGHSGGAATAAILLGMKPKSIDAAVLVACPCDTVAWRAGRRAWTRSENPIAWADRVDPAAFVIALTGQADDNTSPALAQAYVDALRARKIDATFMPLPGETHNGAVRAAAVGEAIVRAVAKASP